MPLSSVVGAQSIVKPGVCTSSTRPASPFEGQMIYETDTDKVLVYNGTAWKQVPTAATAGTVLQVVQGSTATVTSTTTSTYIDSNLTATITPSSSSSLVLVFVSQRTYASAANVGIKLKLLRGSTQLTEALEVNFNSAGSGSSLFNPIYQDSPATTSATTYKTQFALGSGTGTVYTQPSGNLGTITLMEIAG